MKVLLTERAADEIEEILEYLLVCSPVGARNLQLAMQATFSRIADFPYLGRAQTYPGLRKIGVARYPYNVYDAIDEAADEIAIVESDTWPAPRSSLMSDHVKGFTQLEHELMRRIFRRYAEWGFPSLHAFRFVSRKNTGAGRYTYVTHDGEFPHDGAVDLWAHDPSMFEMGGALFQFWAFVDERKVRYLEIVSLGLSAWDGRESDWSFVETR